MSQQLYRVKSVRKGQYVTCVPLKMRSSMFLHDHTVTPFPPWWWFSVMIFSGRKKKKKKSLTLHRWKSIVPVADLWGIDTIVKLLNEHTLWMSQIGGETMTPEGLPPWPCHVSTMSCHRPFSPSCAGISGPAVCAGKGAAIHSYIFWVLSLTTRPSSSNHDIIEKDLKPNVRALLFEPVFTENSCLNRHLEGIRITFFYVPVCECVSVYVQVSIYAWVGYLGTYTDNLFVLEVFA